MPTFAEFTTATAQPSLIMTKFVVMQVLYFLVQSQNLEDDDYLRPACEAVYSLCQFYFTESYQVLFSVTGMQTNCFNRFLSISAKR